MPRPNPPLTARPSFPGPAIAALILAGSACAPAPDGPAGAPKPRSVLWITVDTLRADHLSCYGYERETTPHVDRLAAAGTRFARAYATAPWTLPSVVSLLTGRLPSSHGVDRVDRALPDGLDSIPKRAADRGYATAAVVSNRVVSRRAGLHEHFEHFDDTHARGVDHVSTPGVTDAVVGLLGELAESDEPFLLFALLFDPHYEYADHAELGFSDAPEGRGSRLDGSEAYRYLRREAELDERDRARLTGMYDDEIAFTDRGVGRMLAALEELGLAESTLVVLTADHGEELLDRGFFGHAITLHEELVHVPLVLRGPGVEAGRVVEEPVSLVELGPAIGELLEIPAPGQPTRLAALLEGHAPGAPEPAFFEVDFEDLRDGDLAARGAGLVRGRWKLVRDEAEGTVELYDLEADPGERTDLSGSRPELAEELEGLLDERMARARADAAEVSEREISFEEARELEDLGYVEGD